MIRLGSRAALAAAVAWLASHSTALGVGTIYNIPGDPIPATLLAGETLNLNIGGALPDFFEATAGSTVNLLGGSTGMAFSSSGVVNLYSGMIGAESSIRNGGVLNMYDGVVDVGWGIRNAVANIYGGTLRDHLSYDINNSIFRIYGGVIEASGPYYVIDFDSFFDMFGGTVGKTLRFQFATGRFTGSSFLLDGAPIPGLTPGTSVTFDESVTGTITGVLLDGQPFTAIIDPTFQMGTPIWKYEVTLALVPEPASASLAAIGAVLACQTMALGRKRPKS